MRAVATSGRSQRLQTEGRPASRRSAGISASNRLPRRLIAQRPGAAPVRLVGVRVEAEPARAVVAAAGAAPTFPECRPICPRPDTCRPTRVRLEMAAAAALVVVAEVVVAAAMPART